MRKSGLMRHAYSLLRSFRPDRPVSLFATRPARPSSGYCHSNAPGRTCGLASHIVTLSPSTRRSLKDAGNQYQVDPALVGRQIEVRYRPEGPLPAGGLVWDRQFGFVVPPWSNATSIQLPSPPTRPVPQPTGVDYLGQVLAEEEAHETGSIPFRKLTTEEEETG